MGAKRLPDSNHSLLSQCRPSDAIPGKGCGACGANLSCVHCYMPRLHRTLGKTRANFWNLKKISNTKKI